MAQAVEPRGGRGLDRQEATPVLERPVAGKTEAAALVGGGYETEQQLRPGLVKRDDPQLVDEDEIRPQKLVDDPPDGVVGQAAVQRLTRSAAAK